MNSCVAIFSHCLLLIVCSYISCIRAEETINDTKIDDFFALSPAELAAVPVVTIATGTAKPLAQSASVISVITAEQIKAMGATELHEVLETVPGVHGALQTSQYDYYYSIRAMKNAANSQLLMLLNGTRINTAFNGSTLTHFEMPIEAIQRIEVIRGPASAVYGADAFAGVVNILTKKADDSRGTTIGTRVGNWNTHSTWGQYGTQWDNWKIASSMQYQYTDGDNQRIIASDRQSILDKVFNTHASHAPSAMQTRYETLNGHLNLQRSHWDINIWGFAQFDAGLRAGISELLDPTGKSNSHQTLADIRFSSEDWFKDWELQAHFSYLYTDFTVQSNLLPEGAEMSINNQGKFIAQVIPNRIVLFSHGAKIYTDRVENIPALEWHSIYRGFKQHLVRLITGVRYETVAAWGYRNFDNTIINTNDSALSATDINITNNIAVSSYYLPNAQRIIASMALQDEWQLKKAWQLTTGIRYDYYSDFGSTINPRLALVWDINSQLTSKLLYGKAFRAPSFSEQMYQINPILLGNKQLHPESINTVEMAIDYHPTLNFRSAFNLYGYEVQGLIVPIANLGKMTATFQNFGDHYGYGTELEWDWHIQPQWHVSGNYAWQQSYKEGTHEMVTGIPEHHVYLAVDWQLLNYWYLRPQLNWIGSRNRALNDQRPLADYATVDLTLRGKKLLGHLTVSASLHNMFNSINREPASDSFSQNLPLAGRSFYLEAAVNF